MPNLKLETDLEKEHIPSPDIEIWIILFVYLFIVIIFVHFFIGLIVCVTGRPQLNLNTGYKFGGSGFMINSMWLYLEGKNDCFFFF